MRGTPIVQSDQPRGGGRDAILLSENRCREIFPGSGFQIE